MKYPKYLLINEVSSTFLVSVLRVTVIGKAKGISTFNEHSTFSSIYFQNNLNIRTPHPDTSYSHGRYNRTSFPNCNQKLVLAIVYSKIVSAAFVYSGNVSACLFVVSTCTAQQNLLRITYCICGNDSQKLGCYHIFAYLYHKCITHREKSI